MARSLNKVMIIGNLGKDPELKTFEGGGMLARLAVATSDSYISRKTNEEVTSTEWHNVILRKGLAEVADKYLNKGDKVYIEGALRTRSWTDDKGETRYATEVNALEMVMLGGPRSGGNSGAAPASGAAAGNNANPQPQGQQQQQQPAQGIDLTKDDNEDDLPF